MDNESQPTTKALSVQPNGSLQGKITDRQMVTELERLAAIPAFFRPDMDKAKWQLLYQSYWEDLKHLSLTEMRDACRRYRQNPKSKHFPTAGELLEAAKNPFDTDSPYRKRAAYNSKDFENLPDRDGNLVPPRSSAEVTALIEATRAKYNFGQTDDPELIKRKEEALNRPPLVMTPELIAREKQMAPIRAAALKNTLLWNGD